MTRRLLALILCALMLLTSVAMLFACQEEEDKPQDTSNNESSGDTTEFDPNMYLDVLDQRALVEETLPEGLDFGEEEFRMAVQNMHMVDAWAETGTESRIDDEIYTRNSYVSELLNVTIVEPYGHDSWWMQVEEINRLIASGDDTYDLFLGHAVGVGGSIGSESYYIDLLSDEVQEIGYLNLANPWYPQDIVDQLSINNHMYVLPSDMCLSLTAQTYCMYFNKDLTANYNIPDLYEIVKNGDWTIDKLIELSKDIYDDSNQNNVRDEGDLYGFASDQQSNVNTYMWSCDQDIWSYDPETYEYINTFDTEKTLDILTKVRTLFDADSSTTSTEFGWGATVFAQGNAVFCNGLMGDALVGFADLENYGIIPYPKYDKAQEDYYTMVDGNFSLLAVPMTCKNLEMTLAVIEAMSAYSWKNVIPIYYDLILKLRGTRDNESISMLDDILASRIVDYQYIHGIGSQFDLQNLIQGGQEFSSYMASINAQRKNDHERLLQYFLQ